MKNLLIYINPAEKFDQETSKLVKIQIDNSLSLRWKKEDILLITNFDYEYKGVKAKVIDGSTYCAFRPLSTKTVTVAYLLAKGMIEENELYWVHDLDAYQLRTIRESRLKLDSKDLGLTTYGWSRKWCLGSYFFKASAKDVFQWIRDTIYEHQTEDERALVALTKRNTNNINARIKRLNIAYQIGMRQIEYNYQQAIKPLKIVHFHPKHRSVLEAFMYGKNPMQIPLMTKRLIKIFHAHRIK